MKLASLLMMLALSSAFGAEYSEKVKTLADQLRARETKGGCAIDSGSAIGFAGTPGLYYSLFPKFQAAATDEDLKLMLKDKSIAVRVMGAHCALASAKNREIPADLKAMIKEVSSQQDKVSLAAGGCMTETTTVSEVMKKIAANPQTFVKTK